MLTDAGAAARRTLIMQDEQHAREEALQAQVESFRQQLIQVQQQSADALERMRKDFAEYQREQNRQNQ